MTLRSNGEKTFGLVNGLLLILFSASLLFPFVNLLAVSFTHGASEHLSNVMLWPRPFTTKSYETVLSQRDLYTGYFNTIIRTVFGTAATLVVLLGAAYPLSKRYLPHRNLYTSIFVFTLFFNGGLIPTYLVIRDLGLIDTRLVLILHNLAPAFYLLVMRNFLMGIPAELEDSARIDGANDITILVRIVIPMSTPVIATIGLWSAVWHWNSWFDALIYARRLDLSVLQIWLRRIIITANDYMMAEATRDIDAMLGLPTKPETLNAAAIFVAIAPILVVYPFIQKYFVKGVLIGSLKG